ncbi:MAG: hypothetical protein ISS15_10335 [Alphaproteobacteria bacterium]|nr:hypothetical protein [Alphaproteobacteria bacterium]MBL7098047.1 hypothetical protein [Alphaproteobacteria bacterium]
MNFSIDFAPHVPWIALWIALGLAVALTLLSFLLRARGAWARALVFAALLFAIANPLVVNETRTPLPDVAAIVIDRSQSMGIENRRAQEDAALAAIRKQLGAEKNLEVRESVVTTTTTGEDNGTQLFAGLTAALGDVPPERIAGAILITDGEVHDAPPVDKLGIRAPMHALIAGRHDEKDRKLSVISATRFAIVGQTAPMVIRVDDFGSLGPGTAEVDVRVDGASLGTQVVPVGRNATITVPVKHGGENVVEIEARPGPSELTLQNNRAVVTVSGVRDRLRVLLVSGEPHAGERVWRNLLKADPSVDLVHFTILRPPSKQTSDPTPLNELSLIIFPVRELFSEKLSSFDLIIFDRYSEHDEFSRVLQLVYYDNITNYVENGGALLVASGPEFAQPMSIAHTPLAAVLPAQPSGDVTTQGFKPLVTPQGLAHPVTRDLPGSNTENNPAPAWGRWFRIIGATKVSGEAVMSGPDNKPLLVLDNVKKGRVAELLSDHAWLWARGFEGGGPQAELLRRLAHWLMKEPELEEERLSATIGEGTITIERRTMADSTQPVTLTYPSGKKTTLTLKKVEPGIWRATAKADELGLYRLTDGTLTAVAAAGPLNPKEVADMRATDTVLSPIANATGGSVHWLVDGTPDVRRVGASGNAAGSDWIGLRANGAYRVTSVEQQPLLPSWAALLLLIGTLLLAWRVEGR